MELLAPIKDKASAIVACNLKVDAIYCSGPQYSARSSAGISLNDLKEIIEYAHLYDTKVYVTLNTLIKDVFFSEVITYIDQLVLLNIDALIIQDLGLLRVLKQRYPDLVIHCSTQMHLHNSHSVSFVEKLGVKRIVLARELNLKQIKMIRSKTSLEIETFIHGALCTSYSGQCYYSHFYQTGSGNLGTCQQNCRKLHTLSNKQEHLLSLRDLGLLENISKLRNISDSLKIEGRLKGLNYLYSTIKYYQSVLLKQPDNEMLELLQIAFNRTFTKGRLFNENGNELGNKERINNHGLLVGKVAASDGKYLTIALNKQLTRLDNIRIVTKDNEYGLIVEKLYQNNQEVNEASHNKVKIKANFNLNEGQVYVVKTRRYDKELENYQKEYYTKNVLKAKLEIYYAKPLKLTINNREYLSDFIIEKANKQGMSKEAVALQLNKTMDTPFTFEFSLIGDDNVFVAKSLLNSFRRLVIESEIKHKLERPVMKAYEYEKPTVVKCNDSNYCYMIRTLEQAKALASLNIKEVYVDNLEILKQANELCETIIPVLPRVIKDDYFLDIVSKVKDYPRIMVSELGMLDYFKNKKIIETNYSLNIGNVQSLALLKDYNVSKAITSIETKAIAIEGIASSSFVYGYLPLMIMDYCPINLNKKEKCLNCSLCQEKQYYLFDEFKHKLPLLYRGYDLLELYSHQPLNKLNKASGGMICFTLEDETEVKNIVLKIKD